MEYYKVEFMRLIINIIIICQCHIIYQDQIIFQWENKRLTGTVPKEPLTDERRWRHITIRETERCLQ